MRSATSSSNRARAFLLCAALLTATAPAASVWSERGPAWGGRLTGFVAVPGSSGNTLLAASPGGGVWRSVNGGGAWTQPANYGTGDYSVVHLEWDAVTPGRLFALSYSGLHATTNNGNAWTALIGSGGYPAPLLPYQLSVSDPKPFAQMRFSATQRAVFASIPCGGLYYSFDGTHFTQTWPFSGGAGNPNNCLGTIVADAVSGRVYFSTLAINPSTPAPVYRSDCGAVKWTPTTPCLTWVVASAGLPTNSLVSSMVSVSTPGAGDHLVLQTNGTSSNLMTYYTANGTSWTLQSTLASTWSPRTLLFTGTGQELFSGYLWAGHSSNFGTSWAQFTTPNNHADTRAIYADATAGKVWTSNDGSGNGGNANITRWNWTPGATPTAGIDLGHAGLTVWQAYYAAVVPATGGAAGARRVFMGAQDNAGACSDSLGATNWTASGSPPGYGSGDYFALQTAPSSPNFAYAWSGQTVSFARTTNAASAANCAAVNWTQVTPTQSPAGAQMSLPIFWSRHALAIHPTNTNRVYFAFFRDIGVSTNAGAASVLITHYSLPGNASPTAIYGDSSNAIYVGTAGNGAYVSTNNGQNWAPWGLNTNSPAIITAITSSGGATPTYWIASTSGLYKLQGGTWTLVAGGQGYTVSDVKVDSSCATRVYAAYGFAGLRGQHRGGIDVTSNNGASWTSITSGLAIHQAPVTEVDVDPSLPGSVYAASYGRGFWVFNWGSSLPACAP